MNPSWEVRRRVGLAAVGFVATIVSSSGCGPRRHEKTHDDHGGPRPPRDAGLDLPVPPAAGPARPVVIDAADPDAPCVFGYRGTVLDLGERSQSAHFGLKFTPPPVEWVEHEGSTWARVRGKSLAVDFFVVGASDVTEGGAADALPFVEARLRGGAAKSVSFYLNGHAIGGGSLVRGETRVIAVKARDAQPGRGANELSIRFSGLPKGATEASADLEWVHFGVGDPDPEYAAPTRGETRVSKSFGGSPERSLALRGPGFARCDGWIPNGSVVETRARLEGGGAADAEIRFVRDRVPPTVIGTLHLDGSGAAEARVHSWPIGELDAAGAFGAVELAVVRAARGSRVIFGEPRVLAPAEEVKERPTFVPARAVVLVVMSQVGPSALAAYGGLLPTPAISALAASGTRFDASRATTGVANGAVGSMLTGLTARELGVTDGDMKLPASVTTVADAVRQAGIASAFFTANPLTSAAFGFDRGWSYYESHLPTEEAPATRVYEAAAQWIGDHRSTPFFLMIHARGGHPPWDVSLERVKTLPPENYTGGLDARHAAELLSKSVRTPGSYRFDDADRARAWALYGAALDAEDAGLASVLAAVKAAGLAETTTVLFTSDLGVNEAARVPFAEADSLDELALATPLIVHWAHDPGGTHASVGSSGEDIASTVLAAFGLPSPSGFHGKDLRALSLDPRTLATRPSLATDRDHFALRWGALVSTGAHERETKLCDLSLEPACVTDVRESYPLASRLLHGVLFDDLVNAKPPLAREPASIDPASLTALKMWGR